ncbi:hypothetical protein Ga0102493_111572 [Erythrobacter litoralis]|uniref:Uncharacterized protein n=1 Tax=Erythrobacter litoralis TaxID=39960 RepID=A0A074M9E4_9SPHN|nr:hypothetical protein [Erythrobacter litoralis]AOL22598.1 hypothetical protein Ga0102493_111572 [Erythrobacter litoralis]KEO90034.1 hypothetical protein EH32_03330 [Erythrobacter litoralis]
MLPFPRAHYWVLTLLIATFAAFWPSYFMVFTDASFAHHLHGITATLWMVLIITQSYTIHNGHFRAHGVAGLLSLPLIPLFTAGGLLATQVTVVEVTPFREMFGLNLAFADLVASVFVPFSFFMALRHRRTPDLHARYLLATIFPLIGPVLSRLLASYVPGFRIRAAEELYKFGHAADASFLLTVLVLGWLVMRDARAGKPVLPFTLGLIAVLGMFAYKLVGFTAWWQPTAEALASVPAWLVFVAGLALGSAASSFGWRHPAPNEDLGFTPGVQTA